MLFFPKATFYDTFNRLQSDSFSIIGAPLKTFRRNADIHHARTQTLHLFYHDSFQGGILMSTNPLNSINRTPYQTTLDPKNSTAAENAANSDKIQETKTDAADRLTLTPGDQDVKNQNATYRIDRKKVAEMKRDLLKNTDAFKQMVKGMLEKQGLSVNDVLKQLAEGQEVTVEVDEETRAAAQEAISENGYWGVNKTAERILEFAKSLSGGSTDAIDGLVEAFKAGFGAAKEAFGGELPDISSQTYDKVMEGFDAWRNGTDTETNAETTIEATANTDTES
jgi:anti-sigma28 factor (negative regulator of flagellin synthesis)